MDIPLGSRNLFNYRATFLVLDFNKPKETELCLSSIRARVSFKDYEIVLVSNGGKQNYIIDFYDRGLIDRLVLNKKNYGCGAGTNALYNYCDTELCFYIQNDQYMERDLSELEFRALAKELENGYHCIDLSGGAGHADKFSERALLTKASVLNANPKKGYGGPGPFEKNTFWSEESTQIYFKESNLKVWQGWPRLFANNGRFTVRETEDGKVFRLDLETGMKEDLE